MQGSDPPLRGFQKKRDVDVWLYVCGWVGVKCRVVQWCLNHALQGDQWVSRHIEWCNRKHIWVSHYWCLAREPHSLQMIGISMSLTTSLANLFWCRIAIWTVVNAHLQKSYKSNKKEETKGTYVNSIFKTCTLFMNYLLCWRLQVVLTPWNVCCIFKSGSRSGKRWE